jgi:hypothetical protein
MQLVLVSENLNLSSYIDILGTSVLIPCGLSERSLFVSPGAIKIEDSKGFANAINEH